MNNAILIIGGILLVMILMGRNIVSPKIEEMARAIMDFEGYKEGSVSERNNNPGNLKAMGQAGSIETDSAGHAIFDSFESGWNALINQLKMAFENRSNVYTSRDTLSSFFGKYAEANSEQYAEYVAARLNVGVHDTLESIITA